ncbi:MAG: hypothetical protein AB7G93_19815 [Bdellovibrionales bacterium]
MQARNLMITAISAVLLVGGAACSKKKKKHSPAPAPAPVKADGKTETKVPCAGLEGEWVFFNQSWEGLSTFGFHRAGDGQLHFTAKDQIEGSVLLDGKDQKLDDGKNSRKKEYIINGKCVDDVIVMNNKADGEEQILEWKTISPTEGNLTVRPAGPNPKQFKIYIFVKELTPPPAEENNPPGGGERTDRDPVNQSDLGL